MSLIIGTTHDTKEESIQVISHKVTSTSYGKKNKTSIVCLPKCRFYIYIYYQKYNIKHILSIRTKFRNGTYLVFIVSWQPNQVYFTII